MSAGKAWAFPEEVRLAEVKAYMSGLGNQADVCAAFECSRASLGRWLRAFLAHKSLAPSSIRGKQLPKLGAPELARLRTIVEAHGDLSYERLTELYNADATMKVSRSTVMRGIWTLGFTWKKSVSCVRKGRRPHPEAQGELRGVAREAGPGAHVRDRRVGQSHRDDSGPWVGALR
jgi:transposase